MTVSGQTATINPSSDLVVGNNYYVLMDKGVFTGDTSGDDSLEISDKTAWNFKAIEGYTYVKFEWNGTTSDFYLDIYEIDFFDDAGTNLVITSHVLTLVGIQPIATTILMHNMQITQLLMGTTIYLIITLALVLLRLMSLLRWDMLLLNMGPLLYLRP